MQCRGGNVMNFNIPDLGIIDGSSGFRNLPSTTDGRFTSGEDGVKHIVCTGDGKRLNLWLFENQTLAPMLIQLLAMVRTIRFIL